MARQHFGGPFLFADEELCPAFGAGAALDVAALAACKRQAGVTPLSTAAFDAAIILGQAPARGRGAFLAGAFEHPHVCQFLLIGSERAARALTATPANQHSGHGRPFPGILPKHLFSVKSDVWQAFFASHFFIHFPLAQLSNTLFWDSLGIFARRKV
jgi:hypothetical protein